MKQKVSAVIALAAALAGLHVVQAAARQRSEQAALTPAQTLDRRAIGDLEFSPDLYDKHLKPAPASTAQP